MFFSSSSKRKKSLKKGQIKKIIIYRLSAIGDSALVLPMLKKLKQETNAEIVVICSKENKDIFENQEFIDKIILFQNNTLNPFKILKAIKRIKKEKADIAIDTTQTLNFSAFLSKITSNQNIGFENKKTKLRNKSYDFLTNLDGKRHIVLSYFDLLKHLGINSRENITLVPPRYEKKQKNKAEEILKKQNLRDKEIVGIHAQTLMEHKMWPLENWAKIVDYLAEKNYFPVLIGAPSEEKISKEIINKLKNKEKITNLVGKTTLKETFALMEHFSFFIANDGGPMHVAASFDIPVIGIFGPETPKRYAPFNKKSLSIWKGKGFSCSPCIKRYLSQDSECKNPVCLKEIKPEEVKEAFDILEKDKK